ncbi:MAG: hypothetical protein K2X39_07490 [Silvanigrellaceae bacterium]|nr:hypothetical protein [Silvanigrellaceae bacterium]
MYSFKPLKKFIFFIIINFFMTNLGFASGFFTTPPFLRAGTSTQPPPPRPSHRADLGAGSSTLFFNGLLQPTPDIREPDLGSEADGYDFIDLTPASQLDDVLLSLLGRFSEVDEFLNIMQCCLFDYKTNKKLWEKNLNRIFRILDQYATNKNLSSQNLMKCEYLFVRICIYAKLIYRINCINKDLQKTMKEEIIIPLIQKFLNRQIESNQKNDYYLNNLNQIIETYFEKVLDEKNSSYYSTDSTFSAEVLGTYLEIKTFNTRFTPTPKQLKIIEFLITKYKSDITFQYRISIIFEKIIDILKVEHTYLTTENLCSLIKTSIELRLFENNLNMLKKLEQYIKLHYEFNELTDEEVNLLRILLTCFSVYNNLFSTIFNESAILENLIKKDKTLFIEFIYKTIIDFAFNPGISFQEFNEKLLYLLNKTQNHLDKNLYLVLGKKIILLFREIRKSKIFNNLSFEKSNLIMNALNELLMILEKSSWYDQSKLNNAV